MYNLDGFKRLLGGTPRIAAEYASLIWAPGGAIEWAVLNAPGSQSCLLQRFDNLPRKKKTKKENFTLKPRFMRDTNLRNSISCIAL